MNRVQKLLFLCLSVLVASVSMIWLITTEEFEQNSDTSGHMVQVIGLADDRVFAPVLPNPRFTLPADFAQHPDFRYEWWQVISHVKDESGNQFWLRWRFFRYALDEAKSSGWSDPQIYISNVVLNGPFGMFTDQRIARGGIGQAGTDTKPFKVWIDEWSWLSTLDFPMPSTLKLETAQFSTQLTLSQRAQFAPLGDKGYQPLHQLVPLGSYVLDAPFTAVSGTLRLKNQGVKANVKGHAWVSKEWSSELLSSGYIGDDNLLLWLTDSKALRLRRYRYDNMLPYITASVVDRNGHVETVSQDEIMFEILNYSVLKSGRRVPLTWKLQIPSLDIEVMINARKQDNWTEFVVPQWQGVVHATGSHRATGYMQLSGY